MVDITIFFKKNKRAFPSRQHTFLVDTVCRMVMVRFVWTNDYLLKAIFALEIPRSQLTLTNNCVQSVVSPIGYFVGETAWKQR